MTNENDQASNPQSVISALQNIATALFALARAIAAAATFPAMP
jgi:hypothetical protein